MEAIKASFDSAILWLVMKYNRRCDCYVEAHKLAEESKDPEDVRIAKAWKLERDLVHEFIYSILHDHLEDNGHKIGNHSQIVLEGKHVEFIEKAWDTDPVVLYQSNKEWNDPEK